MFPVHTEKHIQGKRHLTAVKRKQKACGLDAGKKKKREWILVMALDCVNLGAMFL